MVKFGRQLETETVTEWSEFYLDYKSLRKVLKRQKASDNNNIVGKAIEAVRSPLPPRRGGPTVSETNLSSNTKDNLLNVPHTNVDFDPEVGASEESPLLMTDPSNVTRSDSIGSRHSNENDYEAIFLDLVKHELHKISEFYKNKMFDYNETFGILKSKTDALIIRNDDKALYHIRQSFIELYRHINLLESYSILNYTGFSKILKKHDKQSNIKLKKSFFKESVMSAVFVDTDGLKNLLSIVQEYFAEKFEDGDRIRARNHLLTRREDQASHKDSFYFGASVGCIPPMIGWVIYQFYNCMKILNDKDSEVFLGLMPAYYCVGLVCLLIWSIGYQLMIWTKYRINYCYIFEMNPRTRMTYHQVFTEAAKITCLYLVSLLIFLLENRERFHKRSQVYPIMLMVYLLVKLFNPLKIDYYATRRFVLGVLFNVIIAPFGRIRFVDFFVADILTSMVKVFTELASVICTIVTGAFETGDSNSCTLSYIKPVIIAIPLWFRFMQCLRRYHDTKKRHPNLPNALKYSVSFVVVLFAAFHSSYSTASGEWNVFRVLWLVAFVGSTSYTFIWDVLMDWDLGHVNHKFLRENRLIPSAWIYYLVIFVDLVLRFVWTLTLLPDSVNPFWSTGGYFERNLVTPIFGALEIVRRAMWGCFRLEAEHLGGGPETYREIASIPLKFNTETDNLDLDRENERSNRTTLIEVLCMVVAVVALATISYFVDKNS